LTRRFTTRHFVRFILLRTNHSVFNTVFSCLSFHFICRIEDFIPLRWWGLISTTPFNWKWIPPLNSFFSETRSILPLKAKKLSSLWSCYVFFLIFVMSPSHTHNSPL